MPPFSGLSPSDLRVNVNEAPTEALPFGRWVLQQIDRGGFIGDLAKAAKADRAFPKDGDPVAVRKRLSAQGADPDMHDALDDAELDWAAL
ncbi:hypothetical protein [Sphingobium sp.]|uniref:hypothetical protein n=1 Tax=Sphingobium sp. TaxID=1912891 RepID=UPI002BA4D1EC|nr:hypothetical protein [Sphingobium sp.]HUD90082.1 hypothetical protein [Sphingobium sp.]